MPEIENSIITNAKLYLDWMSVSGIQNQRPWYSTAAYASPGADAPLRMVTSGPSGAPAGWVPTSPGAALPAATSVSGTCTTTASSSMTWSIERVSRAISSPFPE